MMASLCRSPLLLEERRRAGRRLALSIAAATGGEMLGGRLALSIDSGRGIVSNSKLIQRSIPWVLQATQARCLLACDWLKRYPLVAQSYLRLLRNCLSIKSVCDTRWNVSCWVLLAGRASSHLFVIAVFVSLLEWKIFADRVLDSVSNRVSVWRR